ncbi:M48 family metallopeptidase [Roseobacter sp. N2S]|uniref:M48 family metallopeptidase n=1 Tax=Roseobacter sp. N2S TaxID=2663844 RepID=UPI0028551F6D|nr:M48 family metallopeptidase [Roseobacter sp. N2S]MDR6264388.1 Zn-dependent protease with chaperone function [Roseobacter sp. N2S]
MPSPTRPIFKSALVSGLAFLAACTSPPPSDIPQQTAPVITPETGTRPLGEGLAAFGRVHKRILPVAKAACRRAHPGQSETRCAFQFVVALDRGQPPDAKFTRDPTGRPVILFNHAMVRFLRSDDEFAMVMAHEMSHQIADHITRGQTEVMRGALKSAEAAKKEGRDVNLAARAGAETALVAYSKQFELEADRNGTILMMLAGYNPDEAITLLSRLPRSTGRLKRHPSDPDRITQVRAVAQEFRAARLGTQQAALSF